MTNNFVEQNLSFRIEAAYHTGESKGLVGVFWETVADLKAGHSWRLCISYLAKKRIWFLLCSDYFSDPTPNHLGSISPDKFQKFVVYFNGHGEFLFLIVNVKFQAGWKTISSN